jgi:leucyl/phenylalanyl-tRNA---protein transferase
MNAPAMLDDRLWFPEPGRDLRPGCDNGLVAVGGDLSVPRLLLAYRSGLFPWTDAPLTWWSPDPRAVIELEQFHIPRSLKKTLRRNPFQVTSDQAFRAVMEGCAEAGPRRRSTWISRSFVTAYTRLHTAGHAHSVECWLEDRLAGGIYGVAIGAFFAGESMFHRASNASKVALCHLVERLKQGGFVLFDIQMLTPATVQMGATLISREAYLERLTQAVKLGARF